jgi:hypothetical protein
VTAAGSALKDKTADGMAAVKESAAQLADDTRVQ